MAVPARRVSAVLEPLVALALLVVWVASVVWAVSVALREAREGSVAARA